MAEIDWKPRKKKRNPVVPPPVEIRSGAIVTCDFTDEGTPVYHIEANTARGSRTFSNFRELLERQAEDRGTGRFNRGGIWWQGWASSVVMSEFAVPSVVMSGFTAQSAPALPEAAEEVEPSAEETLKALASPNLDATKRRQLILAAEGLRFDADQVALLEPILRQYVDRHLNGEIREEQLAVASAIRKLVAMLPVTQLSRCEDWLKIERKTQPPLEMEVVKMIARKLTATLPEDTGHLGPLGDQLIDLLRSYLNPRTLSKRFFGATALEASISLALMGSEHLGDAAKLLRALRASWFRTAVARQAGVIKSDLEQRFPGSRSAIPRRCLAELVGAAESVQP